MKCFLQNLAAYMGFGLISVFILHSPVLLCLVAAPCGAETAVFTVDNPISYDLSREYAGIQVRLDPSPNGYDATTFLAQSEARIGAESSGGETVNSAEIQTAVEPITRALPIWGEKVRTMGYDLPLPFGTGVNLVYIDQGIDVHNLKIGFGGANRKVGSVKFSDASVRDTAATARLDVWLLPFANIYGIIGTIDGEAELDVNLPGISIDVPGFGTVPILDPNTLHFDIDYSGTTYGGGITLAGGYKNFFGTLDANYTYTDIDIVDGNIKTLTISPRLGVRVDPLAVKGSLALWVGAMYMDYKQTVTETVNLKELDSSLPSANLDFEIDIKNEEPWNFLMGGQWEITKRWQITAEAGVGNRRQIILGASFRF